ncbi:MAG: glycosyltransferase family 39 protein [Candidatus Hydrogenedentes bacterium]|nr:glycosyltransferase family 39 protein [Candidatus Hydrogenedentota bacterium]
MAGGKIVQANARDVSHVFHRFRLTYAVFFALLIFVCAGFTASASWVLLLFQSGGENIGGPNTQRLLIKAIFFSALFVSSVATLLLLRRRMPTLPSLRPARKAAWNQQMLLPISIVIALVTLSSTLRLPMYPHIEPDETHHLIVARNVAMHGVYGSGMPATGFRPFDDYDSVGPTVLLPVAASILCLGNPFHAGRLAMAVFYLALTFIAFSFLAQTVSANAAALGAAFMLFAPGSLYLARTLYGEAPALMYLLAAMIVWGRALDSAKPLLLCSIAGLLFGCALVTKYVLVLAAWPGLGMWYYDFLTHRRIRMVHALTPAGVALCVLASWVTITSVFGPQGSETAEGHLAMYQHNLLFGLDPLSDTLAWLAEHWIAAVLFLCLGLISASIMAMLTTYNPAWLFLALFGLFNTYWWVFFTTANHPRYLWYSFAIGALFAGTICANGFRMLKVVPGNGRWIGLALSLLMITLAAWNSFPRFRAMLTTDKMRDERKLLYTLAHDYPGKKLATTFYPAERIVNLFAELSISRVTVKDDWTVFDVVILDQTSQSGLITPDTPIKSVGRYAIIEPAKEQR